jgi:succinate-semialdehyde dehydrogenase/glutarate-semialdehyde dehydrogenase
MQFDSINPATGKRLASFEADSELTVEAKVEAADRAFRDWRRTPFSRRSALMVDLAAHLREDRDHYAAMATIEMGKPIGEAEAEIEKCAWAAEFFAEHAESMLGSRAMPSTAVLSYVQYQPLGVVLEIMPWNFPFWQAIRAAIPILMGGNVALLKHASNVPQCALAIEAMFREVGFPVATFQTLLVSSSAVERLIADDRVAAVTLTGSDTAGAAVARLAGGALKKCVLELGGSDPFIVLEDADLAKAANVGCRARNQNNGQSCIAAKRFVVHESVADEWERRFCDNVAALRIGDPMDRITEVGPLARADLVTSLTDQLDRSVMAGARVSVGGRSLDGPGYYFQPTVLTQTRRDMAVLREETFGPLAAVVRVRDDEEALRVANDSKYGLGASIWTSPERGQSLASRIETGMVFVNGMVASDPRLPFGGVKRSGIGRELSEFGLREFQSLQTVWIGG